MSLQWSESSCRVLHTLQLVLLGFLLLQSLSVFPQDHTFKDTLDGDETERLSVIPPSPKVIFSKLLLSECNTFEKTFKFTREVAQEWK